MMTSPDARVEIWLVRHGQTTANVARTVSGWTDVHLTADGETQASALSSLLKNEIFDTVWSSDLYRAVTTARLAYGEPRVDPRLRELHFGEVEGSRFDQMPEPLRDALLAFVDFQAPGGEHLDTFKERLLDFISGLPPGRHLIFTHGGVIRMLTAKLGIDKFVANTGVAIVDWSRQKIIRVIEGSGDDNLRDTMRGTP